MKTGWNSQICEFQPVSVLLVHRSLRLILLQSAATSLGYNTPDNYCKRFYRGELEHRDTFSQRILSEKPKFVQKRKERKK